MSNPYSFSAGLSAVPQALVVPFNDSTTAAPSSGLGQNGDFAFGETTGNIWGPKANGAWPSTAYSTLDYQSNIAFDSSTNGGIVNPGTSLTWSHTCSTGPNRVLMVAAFGDTTDALTGATYNGVSMTLVTKVQVPSDRYLYVWVLVAPATGANNVVVSAGSSVIICGASSSYTGVNQVTPTVDANATPTGNGTTLAASVTTLNNNDWTFAAFRSNTGTESAGTGTTARITPSNGLLIGDSNGAISPTGSTTMNFTNSTTANMAAVICSLVPARPTIGLLNRTAYAPSGATTYSLVVSTTGLTALDSTNLACSFVVPSSGAVLVKLTGFVKGGAAAGTSTVFGITSTTSSPGTVVGTTALASFTPTATAADNGQISTTTHLVTGLTPGTLKTWYFAAMYSGTQSSVIVQGSTSQTTVPTGAPGVIEVWAA